MIRPSSQTSASAYRWMLVTGFSAVVTFTVIAGYYLPAQREAARLRSERQKLDADHATALEQLRTELDQRLRENAGLKRELEAQKSAGALVGERIEKLERLLSAQFNRLLQAKMMVVSSAPDRVSVA
ncbi:MAG TPA: hypothetical protein VMG12_40060, partial [Polyangiaceae bacterium]|nr:hypothetical protein [Polyangiaceae bacterium]